MCTDYSDLRKSAFQKYAAVTDFSAAKGSSGLHGSRTAAVEVTFVAATIVLGICLALRLQ
jgi:hypothetical protein